uniref:ABC transporter family G domain-containing protein n=1 Tax=Oryza meridionalis TaxID=40149 RepID=A0A0E0DB60_9ORYZ
MRDGEAFRRLPPPLLLLLLLAAGVARGQQTTAPPVVPDALNNLTRDVADYISHRFSFCVADPTEDWNEAFNYTSDLGFVQNCLAETRGDLGGRLCTPNEVKFYFSSLYDQKGEKNLFLKTNINCNRSSWVQGCEPGWACSVGSGPNPQGNIPPRTASCQPCCEGFFCPRGLTCMLPCPLGSYCPRATVNTTTGLCDPYKYQITPNTTGCGGADTWADFGSTEEMFCPAGTIADWVPPLKTGSCKEKTENENIVILGGCLVLDGCLFKDPVSAMDCRLYWKMCLIQVEHLVQGMLFVFLLIIYNCSGQFLTIREKRKARSRENAIQLARQQLKAHEGWKAAKRLARKHVNDMQSHLSRTFSRRRSFRQHLDSENSGHRLQEAPLFMNQELSDSAAFSAHRSTGEISEVMPSVVVDHILIISTIFRLSATTAHRHKVLTVERMVMEPSLLILDEPTSGLDSSSSQLLLRALRHEALEGVNVCAVVHQPSYTLYNMFDDLILLAKGGLIVYNGPVKSVEDYFSTLGITVPERVNPPDHYIDILEGIVKPESGINAKHFPLHWMLYNGYEVPSDMKDDLKAIGEQRPHLGSSPSAGSTPHCLPHVRNAFAEERDRIEHHLSKPKDLSSRRTPGVIRQYKYYLGRVTKQRLREARLLAVDFLILGLAGICLGTIAKLSDPNFGMPGYIYTIIAVSLLCKISALRSFSLERLQYLRERESGMSSLAYFLARDTIDHFSTIVKPIVYLSMFYYFNNPRSTITDNYIILLALVYCVTGIGYTFAICFNPGSAQLCSALIPVVLTLLSTQNNTPAILNRLCYPKWALEGFIIVNAKRYPGVWLITRCGLLFRSRFDIHHYMLCILVLFMYGLFFRIVAFVALILVKKR